VASRIALPASGQFLTELPAKIGFCGISGTSHSSILAIMHKAGPERPQMDGCVSDDWFCDLESRAASKSLMY